MKAWTYASAPSAGPYWRALGTPIILMEYPSGHLEWRTVETGEICTYSARASDWYQQKPLDPKDYPQWYRDLDDYGMDEGL